MHFSVILKGQMRTQKREAYLRDLPRLRLLLRLPLRYLMVGETSLRLFDLQVRDQNSQLQL